MESTEKILEIIDRQEQLLQFDSFDNETAIRIGLLMLEKSRKAGKSVAVEITRCGHRIFHAALDGTSPDITDWMRRKMNTVCRVFRSTLWLQMRLKRYGVSLEKGFHLSPADYVDSGGGFPIVVKNVGFIGAIVASGTSDRLEHELIVETLAEYLGVADCPHIPVE